MGNETKKVRITSQNWIDGMERYFPELKAGDEIAVIEDEEYPDDYLIIGSPYSIPKTDCEIVTDKKEKLRVRIKSGIHYNESTMRFIFDATDISSRDEQKYQLHYNGQYFSCPKEDCEIIVAGEKPKFVTEDVSGVSITYVPNPDSYKRMIIDFSEEVVEENNPITEAIKQTIKDLDNDLVKSNMHIGEVWKEPKEASNSISVSTNTLNPNTKHFMRDYYDLMLKIKEKEYIELMNQTHKVSPVIINDHFQFNEEDLERLYKLQEPTDTNKVKYFIGADSFNDSHSFCLSKESNGSMEIIFTKSFDNKDEFKRESFQLSKIFKARIITENVIDFLNTDSSRSEKIEITVDGNTYFINRKAWTLEKELRKYRNQLFDGTISQDVYDLLIETLLP